MACTQILRATRPVALAAALALGVTGCAGGGPGGMFGPSYTIAADDACGPQRQALKAYQDYFFSSMIQGAAMGAVAGGLTGLLIGGDAKGAAIGAGAGALVGGIGGYYAAKQKANNDPVALTNSVYLDVSKENGQIDGVSAAFGNLRDCRLRTASAVKRDYAAKTTSQADAQTRLQRIRQLYVEDVTFAESLGSKIGERGNEYDNASNQIVQMNPNARQQAATRETASGPGPSGPALVANEAARLRETPSGSSRQIAAIGPGDTVTQIEPTGAASEWAHVRMTDGRTGYVASRLLRPAGTRAPSSVAPPSDAAGVVQLTESNQLKRKALTTEVAQAKTEANGSSFELSGGISRWSPQPERHDAG